MKLTFLMLVALLARVVSAAATTRIQLVVVDESTGTPVPDVSVVALYDNPNSPLFDRGVPDKCRRETRIDGSCIVKCTTADDSVEFSCEKDGYYRKIQEFSFANLQVPITTTVMLSRVVRPIPLYVNLAEISIDVNPGANADKDTLEYDLVAGDWLAPYGTGSVADVVLTRRMEDLGPFDDSSLEGEKPRPHRATLVVDFPGKDNGIVAVDSYRGMNLLVREAPETGYVQTITQVSVLSNDCSRSELLAPENLCFRIRSVRTADGMVQGLYGKVYDGFRMRTVDQVVMRRLWFRYYLNPTPGDRNLEFDGKTNLGPARGMSSCDPW